MQHEQQKYNCNNRAVICLLGVSLIMLSTRGVKSPKLNFRGINGHFQAKRTKKLKFKFTDKVRCCEINISFLFIHFPFPLPVQCFWNCIVTKYQNSGNKTANVNILKLQFMHNANGCKSHNTKIIKKTILPSMHADILAM